MVKELPFCKEYAAYRSWGDVVNFNPGLGRTLKSIFLLNNTQYFQAFEMLFTLKDTGVTITISSKQYQYNIRRIGFENFNITVS